jgi:hypothetical protein
MQNLYVGSLSLLRLWKVWTRCTGKTANQQLVAWAMYQPEPVQISTCELAVPTKVPSQDVHGHHFNARSASSQTVQGVFAVMQCPRRCDTGCSRARCADAMIPNLRMLGDIFETNPGIAFYKQQAGQPRVRDTARGREVRKLSRLLALGGDSQVDSRKRRVSFEGRGQSLQQCQKSFSLNSYTKETTNMQEGDNLSLKLAVHVDNPALDTMEDLIRHVGGGRSDPPSKPMS